MRRTTRSVLLLALAVLALLLGACGSSDEPMELTVVGTEMAFDAPATTPAGDYVVRFKNHGAVFHEVAIKDAAGRIVRRVQAPPGGTSTMEVSLAAGAYELGCFEPGHYAGGMHRPLTVE
jgi:uncharacterized cupredoxin-like copper-binding protein